VPAARRPVPSRQPDQPRCAGGRPWAPVTLQIDLDGDFNGDPVSAVHMDEWEDSALALAGRAYRRECGWDLSPGEAGTWLLSAAPYSSMGGDDLTNWTGTLTGFAILHDRYKDGGYAVAGAPVEGWHVAPPRCWSHPGPAGT
jgi:hypothetical protein